MTMTSPTNVLTSQLLAQSLRNDAELTAFRRILDLQQPEAGTRSESFGAPISSTQNGMGGTRRIGIWENSPVDQNTFTRAIGKEISHFWSATETIGPKVRDFRIVLIGESVARGYFYDPIITPARMLEEMLTGTAAHSYEVVDLARTDINMEDLLTLATASVALLPDAIICFAGNNWHPLHYFLPNDLLILANRIREEKTMKVAQEMLKARHISQAQRFIRELATLGATREIPVIVMIPEFNLADWRSDIRSPGIIEDEKLGEWLQTKRLADEAIDRNDMVALRKESTKLIELDEGTTPVGYNYLALDPDIAPYELRMLLEKSRDAEVALTHNCQTPRCPRYIQDTLRQECLRHHITVIDLPHIFADHLNTGIPDRSMFNDYCHLSIEGMRTAMSHVATSVVEVCTHEIYEPRIFSESKLTVPSRALSEAHFMAAIHNVKCGNSTECARFHLEKSIALDQTITTLLHSYLFAYLTGTPLVICSEFQEFSKAINSSLTQWMFTSPRTEVVLDIEFAGEMAKALRPFYPGIDSAVEVALISHHAVDHGKRNLLSKTYFRNMDRQATHPECFSYRRVCEQTSSFTIVCHTPQELAIEMEWRTAEASTGDIECFIGNRRLSSFTSEAGWNKRCIAVDAMYLNPGLNEFTIVWPSDGWKTGARLPNLLSAFEDNLIPETRPIFAELSTLTVQPSQVASRVA